MDHDVVTELFYDGAWHAAPVFARDGVELSRGAGSEDEEAPPATAALTFDNSTGDYNPRNALSPLYGNAGRNTPMRVSVASAQTSVTDTFTRSVSNSWGSSTGGGTWSLAGTGAATVNDFDVTGSAGTMAGTSTSAYHLAWLPDVTFVDCEVYAECTVAASTGGALEPTLVLRALDDENYYMIRANLFPASGIDVAVRKLVDNTDTLIGTEVGVSAHTAANPIKIRARIVGMTIEAKAWQGSVEPDGWQLSVVDGDLVGAGGVGIRSGIGGGNSNTKPVVFTWDNFSATPINVRSTVEVSSWAPGRNANNTDRWTGIQGGGILRRLGQGDSVVRSAAYQAYMSPENDLVRVDYWPLEEESGASVILSPAGSTPMTFDDVEFGGDTTSSPSSARLVTLGTTGFIEATVRPYTSTTSGVHLLYTLPENGLLDQEVMMRIHFRGGTVGYADVIYGLPNALTLRLYNFEGVTIGDSGPWGPFNIDGNHFLLRVLFIQLGADLDTLMSTSFVDDSPWLYASQSFLGQTAGRIHIWRIHAAGASVGHAAIGSAETAFDNYTRTEGGVVGLKGFRDETAGARFLRIAEEAGIRAYVHGDPTDTQPMGPQPVATVADILSECVRTDDGILFEPRADRAVVMRTGRSRYNQAPALQLDFEGGQISPDVAPALDDRHTRNDITANRRNGSSARAVRETGPLNVNDPISDPDGVGRYDTTVEVNTADDAALPQHAYWHLHRGTVDDPRYAELTVDLDRAPDLRAAVDAVEIGDRITISNMPTDWQQDPGDLIVVGIRESYPPGTAGRRRTVTFVTIPASQFEIGVVGAEDGTVDLRGQAVDTDASTLAAAAATAADARTVEGFESGTTGWSGTNCTLSQSTAQARSGTASMQLVVTGSPTQAYARPGATAVTPGAKYTATMWVYSAAGFPQVTAAIDMFDSGMGYVTGAYSAGYAVPAGVWTAITVSGTVPAGVAFAQFGPTLDGNPPGGTTMFLDEVEFARTTDLSVASASGVLWTTDPDDWDPGLHGSGTYGGGLHLRVGGEVMRATNIAHAVTDTFGRTEVSAWGTANSGQAWTVSGTASQYAVTSGTGRITPGATSSDRFTTLTADQGADRIVQCDIQFPALPASGLLAAGVLSRFVDSGNHIVGDFRITSAGAVTVRLGKRVAGTGTNIATYTHPTTYVAGRFWRIVLESRGSRHRLRAWDVFNQPDPGWHIDTTDASIPTGTEVGCYARNETAVTSHTVHFDSFAVPNPQTITVVRSVNGVEKTHPAGTKVNAAHPVRVGL